MACGMNPALHAVFFWTQRSHLNLPFLAGLRGMHLTPALSHASHEICTDAHVMH